jgi:hypothetical protein
MALSILNDSNGFFPTKFLISTTALFRYKKARYRYHTGQQHE